MKNFAQLTIEFNKREALKKQLVRNTNLKAFEVNYSVPTPEGIKEGQRFVKGQCPKQALKSFKEQMNDSGHVFYEVNEIVSPHKVKGNVVYRVFNNLHILR